MVFSKIFSAFSVSAYLGQLMETDTQGMMIFIFNDMLGNGPEPQLLTSFFKGEYSVMFTMAVYAMVPLIVCATVGSFLRGGYKEVIYIYMAGLPISVCAAAATLSIVDLCQRIDKDLVAAVWQATSRQIAQFQLEMKAVAGSPTSDGWSVLGTVGLMFALIAISISGLFIWFELYFREVMIYLSTLFIPLSLAAYLWGPIRIWFYNLAEIVITMVFAKFVVAAILSFGFLACGVFFDQTATVHNANVWGVAVGGATVFFLAAVAMPMLISFVMAPNHSILHSRQVIQLTPFNNTREFARGQVGNVISSLIRRR